MDMEKLVDEALAPTPPVGTVVERWECDYFNGMQPRFHRYERCSVEQTAAMTHGEINEESWSIQRMNDSGMYLEYVGWTTRKFVPVWQDAGAYNSPTFPTERDALEAAIWANEHSIRNYEREIRRVQAYLNNYRAALSTLPAPA